MLIDPFGATAHRNAPLGETSNARLQFGVGLDLLIKLFLVKKIRNLDEIYEDPHVYVLEIGVKNLRLRYSSKVIKL